MTAFRVYKILCGGQGVAVCVKKASRSVVAAVGYGTLGALSRLVSSEVGAVHLVAVCHSVRGFTELSRKSILACAFKGETVLGASTIVLARGWGAYRCL